MIPYAASVRVYALSVANRRSPSPAVPATAQQRNVDPTWLAFDTGAKTVRSN